MTTEPAAKARTSRCPVCGVEIAALPMACPDCHTAYHAECWGWLGGCAIYGCSQRAPEGTESAAAAGEAGTGVGADGAGAAAGGAEAAAGSEGSAGVGASGAAGARGRYDGPRVTPALERPKPPELPEPAAAHDLVVDTPLQQEPFSTETPLPSQVRAFYFAFFALLFPFFPIVAIVLAGLPFVLTRVRWQFDAQLERLEGVVSIAGLPVHRRVIPLHEVVRMEIQSGGPAPGLQVVLHDGSHVALTHAVNPRRSVVRRLLSVARGVAVHTPVHLTMMMRRDPVTCRKRLESLKALSTVNVQQLDRAALTSYAALPAMALAVILGAPVWTGATTLITLILAGGLAAAAYQRFDEQPLGKSLEKGWITERGVEKAEHALRDRFPTLPGFWLGTVGHVTLIAVMFLLAGLRTQFSLLALIWAAIGAGMSAADWARAQNVQRRLPGAELYEKPEPEPPPPPLLEGPPNPGTR